MLKQHESTIPAYTFDQTDTEYFADILRQDVDLFTEDDDFIEFPNTIVTGGSVDLVRSIDKRSGVVDENWKILFWDQST